MKENFVIIILLFIIIILIFIYKNKNEYYTSNESNINSQTNNALNDLTTIYNTTDLAVNNLLNTNIMNTEEIIADNIKGIIVAWSGTTSNIPSGWGLCDGTVYQDLSNNPIPSPDLRSRFIVGACDMTNPPNSVINTKTNNPINLTPYTVNAQSGEETHTLTLNEMPAHTHDMTFLSLSIQNGSYGPFGTFIQNCASPSTSKYGDVAGAGNGCWSGYYQTMLPTGKNGSHQNMPPYYALAYIIKTT